MYKLAIIGGGPAGYVAAEKAARAGLPTILFEAGELGGVCLNEGCIPTKTLLYSAKILDQAREASKYGVNITDATPDFPSIMKRKEKVVKKLVGGVRVRLRDAGVEVIKVPVTIKGRSGEAFELEAQGESYLAEKLLVCTRGAFAGGPSHKRSHSGRRGYRDGVCQPVQFPWSGSDCDRDASKDSGPN